MKDKINKIPKWGKFAIQRISNHGVDGVSWAGLVLYRELLAKSGIHPFEVLGTCVYEKEWDMLVVLDGCRIDLLCEVIDEFEFLRSAEFDALYSVGTTSEGWLRRTFTASNLDKMRNTAYVSANPFTDPLLDSTDFLRLDEVWRYGYDDQVETIRPRSVTDRTIQIDRQCSAKYLVTHYMQPHFPSIPRPELRSGLGNHPEPDGWEDNIWSRLRDGEVTKQEVWDAYRANLRHVLKDVALLLNNTNRERVVITSDHGNATGEWGIYGHHENTPINCLWKVPWVITHAEDKMEYEPEIDLNRSNTNVDEQLSALGYKSD